MKTTDKNDKSKMVFSQILDALKMHNGDDAFIEKNGLFYKANEFDLTTLQPKPNAPGVVRIVDGKHFKIGEVKIYF